MKDTYNPMKDSYNLSTIHVHVENKLTRLQIGLSPEHLTSTISVRTDIMSRNSSVSNDTVDTILCRLCRTGMKTCKGHANYENNAPQRVMCHLLGQGRNCRQTRESNKCNITDNLLIERQNLYMKPVKQNIRHSNFDDF